jgi:hypothetical protein
MVAFHAFTGDHNDVMPDPNWDRGIGTGPGWLYTIDSSVAGSARFKLDAGLFWDTLRNPKLYVCPMDKSDNPNFSSRSQQLSSYAMNGAVIGYDRLLNPPLHAASMAPTACALWETDETHPEYFNDGANYPLEGVSARHSQGAIQAAFDGSVNYVKLKDWIRDVADIGRNRLWCYPNSDDGR